ncbi:MAG: phosphonopyruvate decarboxylase [Candidatus Nitrohelix vancouverensis]|uniref:Phosphonopyruvate decarboxylase n=1 Tax=Candidatus Nitrohelix vancouverensis TaxID=2705534 RepID=A0A7T0G2Q9_9BACT|nr:MAG: phosphonopyruvate decarboxylase [Candidatus Nitrohelix vancouverensis]
MIDNKGFYDLLLEQKIDFFTGVPDSLLKDFCAWLTDNADSKSHIITANEGAAVGLGMGYHLATGKIPLVYMQNSGLGNSINPLLSLTDREVYSIPLLLLVGWRGEPGVKDEPQHVKQGKVMLPLMDAMELPCAVMGPDSDAEAILRKAGEHFKAHSSPYAILVQKGSFETHKLKNAVETDFPMNREQAIERLLRWMAPEDVVVSTTGMTSREVFEIREAEGQGHAKDFLTVGGMGHASQIALGVAMQKPGRRVYCIDGDGAALMHLGSLAINGLSQCDNFKHVLINNGAHDSVGGQPTAGFDVDFGAVARALGYATVLRENDPERLADALDALKNGAGPGILEIRVNKGARKDLGRPTTTPTQNKTAFMQFLS